MSTRYVWKQQIISIRTITVCEAGETWYPYTNLPSDASVTIYHGDKIDESTYPPQIINPTSITLTKANVWSGSYNEYFYFVYNGARNPANGIFHSLAIASFQIVSSALRVSAGAYNEGIDRITYSFGSSSTVSNASPSTYPLSYIQQQTTRNCVNLRRCKNVA